ncbi:MAG TPA: tripartite tricarboxylate transporter substrate binding protein [Burkholderiales bacterium]|nr:tripartite tricarboxylate transporter substrate binding protein [Burkholderiales bacterium]
MQEPLKWLLILTAGCLLPARPVLAQGYPAKPIRMIVPFPPSAGLDVIARLLAPALSERLRQNVIVDNRTGAGGTIGAELAAKAPADGYTLLMITTSHAFNVSLYKRLAYDMVRDFAPITLVSVAPNLLVVNASLPAATVKDFVTLAKARPREINFASAGVGTSSHLAGELFMSMARAQLVHVPYKGSGSALVALLGGEVQAAFFSIPSTLPHMRSGKLRALGIGSARRSAMLPDLPTIAEAGVAGYDATTWYGALVPAGTPRTVVEKLNLEIAKLMQTPDMRERLLAQGAEPRSSTPEEFAAYLKAEIAKYARLARTMGVQPE